MLGYNKTIWPEAEVAVMIGDDPLVAFSEYGSGKVPYYVGLRAALGAAGVLRMGKDTQNLKGIMDWLTTGANGGSEDEALQ